MSINQLCSNKEYEMIASNDTVVRFVAHYGHGFSLPARHILLGYGYMSKGGLDHAQLVGLYEWNRAPFIGKLYAGYLYIEGGDLKIYKGGSATLKIDAEERLDAKVENDLKLLQGLGSAVRQQFIHITQGHLKHVLLAQQ